MPNTLLTSGTAVTTAAAATVAPVAAIATAVQALVDFHLPSELLHDAVTSGAALATTNTAYTALLTDVQALPGLITQLRDALVLLYGGADVAVPTTLVAAPSAGAAGQTGGTLDWTLTDASLPHELRYRLHGSTGPWTAVARAAGVSHYDFANGAPGAAYDVQVYAIKAGVYSPVPLAGTLQLAAAAGATAPVLNSVTPPSLVQGATTAQLVLAGSAIPSDVTVVFSAAGVTVNDVTRNSTSQVTAHVTISPTATVGAGTVKLHSPTMGDSGTVSFTLTASSTSYATPLARDDMGYGTTAALYANVLTAGGGTGGAGALYKSVTSAGLGLLSVDAAAEALYHGLRTVRYDFLAGGGDTPTLQFAFAGAGQRSQWVRFRAKFKPGFTTAGSDTGVGGAAAYKFLLYGLNVTGGGSGRLELTNGTSTQAQYDNYWTTFTPEALAPNASGINTATEWSDDAWYEFIGLLAYSADNKTLTTKWWRAPDGGTRTLISTCSGTGSAATISPVDGWGLGANYNQTRDHAYALWRGPWDMYDAATYRNPYNVPPTDIADVVGWLGADDSLAQPVAIPAAPGVPTPANANAPTVRTALSFPVTLAGIGGLPAALLVRYSTNGGGTWTAGADIATIAPALGGTVVAQVASLAASTAYTVQFAEYNAGGTSAWSASVTGTTPAADVLPVTAGLVFQLEADTRTDVTANGAALGSVTDSVGSIAFTQATAGAKPTLVTAVTSTGLPVIRLAAGKYLVAAAGVPALANTQQTQFLVAAQNTSSAAKRVIFGNESAGAGWADIITVNVSSDTNAFEDKINGTTGAETGSFHSAQVQCLATVLDPTQPTKVRTYVNGVALSTNGSAPTQQSTTAPTIGTDSANVGTATGSMDFCAKYVFNRVLTGAELTSMYNWIKAKWGTP